MSGPLTANHPPGWHGKLPALGDFASRRLSPALVATWDGWLAAGLLQLRTAQPAGWLEAYLAAPSQRFLLMPGALPGAAGLQAWAGVLMPSVDRVGRYFPFTLLHPLPSPPASPAQLQSLWAWLGRLDELAADALQDDWTIDRLERELACMAGPALAELPATPNATPQQPGALVVQSLFAGSDIAQHLAVEAHSLWQRQAQGLAYWLACADLQAPCLRVSRGLPASAAALLGATI